jgi:asparagine synthase (glutamine-hydrolysing)
MNYLDRYTIIHNGEIYNYIELKEDLQKKAIVFAPLPIPRSYSLLMTIMAMSALNILTVCLRSRYGMKWNRNYLPPVTGSGKALYYSFNNRELAFASEIKALMGGRY